jgi:hypothetical protein
LKANRGSLDSLAESLLIKETLDRVQIDTVMRGGIVVNEDEKKAFYDAQRKSKDFPGNKKVTAATAPVADDETTVPPLSALPQGT